MRHLEINGCSLEYFEMGAGDPVVLVHGGLFDCRSWQPHCSLLARRYRAISYSQRYFGPASWKQDWPEFGIRTHTDDLIELVRRLDMGAVHLIGWSYGAHAALTAVAEQPKLFRSVFVYEPSVPTYVTDPEDLAEISRDGARIFGPVHTALTSGDHTLALRALLDQCAQTMFYFESQSALRQRIELDNARVLPRLLAQPEPPPLSAQQLQRLEPPAAIAWGEATRPYFGIIARTAASLLPGEARFPVPDATHLWPDEQPEAFVDLARAFLDSR